MRPGATRDTSTEWVRGPLKIVLSRSHERLRFEHTERFEVITLNWKDGILRGDARYSELEHSDDEMAAWAIEGWNLTIRLVKGTGGVRVVATFGKEIFEIAV